MRFSNRCSVYVLILSLSVATAILCGCGMSRAWVELEVVLSDLPDGFRPEASLIGVSNWKGADPATLEDRFQTNGHFQTVWEHQSGTWVWDPNAAPTTEYISLTIPSLWTNGYYYLLITPKRAAKPTQVKGCFVPTGELPPSKYPLTNSLPIVVQCRKTQKYKSGWVITLDIPVRQFVQVAK